MEARALRDELMTLLVAGQETSAVLLAWTAAFLAFHPHIQAQAAAEVADVLGGAPPAAHNTRCCQPQATGSHLCTQCLDGVCACPKYGLYCRCRLQSTA